MGEAFEKRFADVAGPSTPVGQQRHGRDDRDRSAYPSALPDVTVWCREHILLQRLLPSSLPARGLLVDTDLRTLSTTPHKV